MLAVWSTTCEMLNVPAKNLQILIDNTAMGEVIRTGRNLTMKHISKTHGIQVVSYTKYMTDQTST